MKIHAIEYARSQLPESMVFAGGSKDKHLEIAFLLYLVETMERKVLIDAGCDHLPGFQMVNFVFPVQALSDYGISAKEITDVIVTHAHHDHIDGLRHFPYAQIHIQKEEYPKAVPYIPETAALNIFDQGCIVADCIAVEKIGGHTAGSSIATVQIGKTRYIFGGDECYLPICLEQNIPTGCSHNKEASQAFLSRFRGPDDRVLLTHDTQIHTGLITERI